MPPNIQGRIPVSPFHPADVVDAGLCVATLIPGTDAEATAAREMAKAVVLHLLYERAGATPTFEDLAAGADRFLADTASAKRLVIANREAPSQTEAVIVEIVTAFLTLQEQQRAPVLLTARNGLRQQA